MPAMPTSGPVACPPPSSSLAVRWVQNSYSDWIPRYLVEEITRTLFDNLDTLGRVHPAAGQISMDRATNTPIDLHPGAEAYFSSK